MDRDDGLRSLGALEQLWHERRGERTLPRRRDFSFEDFNPWLGHIRIIAVEHAPLRFKVTLDGTEIVTTAGVDLTGKYLDSVYGSERLCFLLDGYYTSVRERRPVYETLYPNERIVNFGEIIRILLPCGTGEQVDHIVYCEYAFNVWHWGRTVFANPSDLNL
ncbi:PAS domain-containing protein [Azospirillum sp. sgz301742]